MLTACVSAPIAQNPEVGTWKLNVEKLIFSPGPAPRANTLTMEAVRRIGDYTIERVNKKAGKIVSTTRCEYSKDGKWLTSTVTGTNAKGEPFKNVEVFDRM